MEIEGRTALLTGATGGIGHAIARALAQRGAKLVLTGRRAEVLEPLAAETGGRSLTVDLADRAEVDRLIAETEDVDILIANAALPASGRVEDYSVEEIDRALDVNLRAPILQARALAPRMVERGGGHIVLVDSLSGKSAAARTTLYSATKFGLRGFGLALREDFAGTGVGVSLVYPGFIRDAGMFAESGAQLPKGVGTRTPDDVAGGVVRAIERDKAEISVAAVGLRIGAAFSQLAPDVAARVSRRMGSTELAEQIVGGQTEKR
ncbi:MAG TPA: SDR family NAD(P)-dependent oxidoreductase [Solirubrobacteraceae bacterium]